MPQYDLTLSPRAAAPGSSTITLAVRSRRIIRFFFTNERLSCYLCEFSTNGHDTCECFFLASFLASCRNYFAYDMAPPNASLVVHVRTAISVPTSGTDTYVAVHPLPASFAGI